MDKLIYLNLQSWPDSFKKSIYFDTYFFASSILSFKKKSYDVIAITDVFYQTSLDYIFWIIILG